MRDKRRSAGPIISALAVAWGRFQPNILFRTRFSRSGVFSPVDVDVDYLPIETGELKPFPWPKG